MEFWVQFRGRSPRQAKDPMFNNAFFLGYLTINPLQGGPMVSLSLVSQLVSQSVSLEKISESAVRIFPILCIKLVHDDKG